jgi:hypothetical protein
MHSQRVGGIERLRSASAVLKGPSLQEAGQKKRRKPSSPRSSSYVIKSICDSPRVETIVMLLNLNQVVGPGTTLKMHHHQFGHQDGL